MSNGGAADSLFLGRSARYRAGMRRIQASLAPLKMMSSLVHKSGIVDTWAHASLCTWR